jgi:two-component system cell cycle response regulator DivK
MTGTPTGQTTLDYPLSLGHGSFFLDWRLNPWRVRMVAKIVAIEDNEQNPYVTTFILEKHGHAVVQARNGRAGIAAACQEKPDLILLDIQLPEMDGYAVARQLRHHPELCDTPVSAVTSYAMVGDRERVLAAGCTGYVEKPIDPDTFMAEVERHL